MRIAISTGGGDAPGLNAVIRAVVLTAHDRGWSCVGIRRGFNGLYEGDGLVELGPHEPSIRQRIGDAVRCVPRPIANAAKDIDSPRGSLTFVVDVRPQLDDHVFLAVVCRRRRGRVAAPRGRAPGWWSAPSLRSPR